LVKIFLSYRRDDSRHVSERIYDRLAARFGKDNVFKDVDSIPLGRDFRPALEAAVGACAVTLAIIGPRWLNITEETGQRRLDNANDFVRIELEGSLARNVPVIPVLVDGAALPKTEELPPPLQALSFRQATQVRVDPDFHHDMDRLLEALAEPGSPGQVKSDLSTYMPPAPPGRWEKTAAFLRKPGRRGILLGLLCAVAAWGVAQWAPLRGLEEWLQDGAFSSRGVRTTRARVVLIGLDEPSLEDLKKPMIHTSPEIAEVVSFARAQGALAIGLDFIIPKSLEELPELQAEGPGDATKLGQAIKDTGNVVLAEWKLEGRWLRPLPQWRLKALEDPGATDSGFVNLTEDADTYVRRQQLLIPGGAQGHMNFALALFAQAQHVKKVEWDNTQETLRLDGELVPLDEDQKLRINFVGPPKTFPSLPLGQVLAAARAGQRLSDLSGSIVIIGVTARSQQDYHATPYDNNYARSLYTGSAGLMAGSEIHANIIATLFDRAYITAPPWYVSVGILLLGGAMLGWIYAQLNLAWAFGVALGHHLGWKYLCFATPAYFQWRMEIVPMLMVGALLFGVIFVQRWWLLRRMLGVVKSEAIARLLENNPGELDRYGEERIVTVLFADIRNFSAYAETHAPREVVVLLNAYFTAVVPLIERHGGTLNQYMGDRIMVLFGAPLFRPDHPLQAVRAALAMVKQIHALHPQWEELGFPGLEVGIGIHTGRVVMGLVGSAQRLDYTAIGDTVTTAAQIAAKAAELGAPVLISADTLRDVPGRERPLLGCAEAAKRATVVSGQKEIVLHAVSAQIV
jgi:class 3 adenylate cyclase/CHASE2 domain-containing sensor protein